MKRKTKILISALSVMFVAAIAVAIASFSFAGDGDKNALEEGTQYIAAAGEAMGKETIIDYIIENSNSEDPDVDKIYHIAEITSSQASTLESYVTSDAFKNYVIDGHRTIEQAMADGCVEYRSFSGSVSDSASLKYISNADFIYVSNDGTNAFSKTNDLSEDLYDILHEYALGKFKPLVIDTPKAAVIDSSTSKTMGDLAKYVFSPNEKYYYTFSWPQSMSAFDYLSHTGGSLYLGINGQTQKENGVWTSVVTTVPTATSGNATPADPSSLAKILTITTDGTTAKTTALLNGCSEYTGSLYDATTKAEILTNGSKVYNLDNTSVFYEKGYNVRVDIRPTYIQNDVITLTQADADTVEFDDYDMIVIEASCNTATISKNLYKKFASAMYGKLHIVYGKEMGTGSSSAANDVVDKRETNFLDLFYGVAASDYTSKYENVMVTNRNDFSIITTSSSVSTAKVIADLINASTYRGIGGAGSSSSMFTVLELQPCYPIDEDVATYLSGVKPRKNYKWGDKYASNDIYGSQNNYYTVPADMINGKTKEQLPENTEYYAWELSKAKLADALGISYDKIKLVQMSTEEFAGDKTEILGNYDMIYIGANTTALKNDVKLYQYLLSNDMVIKRNNSFNTRDEDDFPIYLTYSHNGDLVYLNAPHNQNFSGSDLTATVKMGGQSQKTFTYLNGNDITYNRYKDLEAYIQKGMPVVISKKLTTQYNIVKTEEANGNPYKQHVIDPDSNMYKVLKACDQQTQKTMTGSDTNSGTVVWNFDQEKVVNVASDGTLGDSMTGYVSVFAGEDKDAGGTVIGSVDEETGNRVIGTKELLNKVYLKANKRPKMVVKSMPATYNRFDATTRLTDRKLKFTYDVKNSTKYTVSLYVDNDGNSKFDRSETGKEYKTSSTTTTLEYTVPSSFFGPVYWMIELVDDNTGLSVSQTGFSYIQKAGEPDPQPVSVLQIMPENGSGVRANDSLYFCTQCQRASKILEYNPCASGSPGDWYTNYMWYYGGAFNDDYPAATDGVIGYRGDQEIYVGKHQHIFGINSYDSNAKLGQYTGVDDWETNLADEISDLFDFNLDIMTSREFEQMADLINQAFVNVIDDDGNVTSTQVSLASKKAQIKAGVPLSAENIDEFNTLLKESIRAYDSSLTDEQYDALTKAQKDAYIDALDSATINILYVQKKKCDYSVQASFYKSLYETQRDDVVPQLKEDLDDALDEMIGNASGTFKTYLQHVRKTGYYSDYYYINDGATRKNDVSSAYLSGGRMIDTYISAYYRGTDLEMEYDHKYKLFAAYAAGSNWIEACYDTVVLGPSESFNGDDIKTTPALDALEAFIANQNQVVLFHDTLTYYNDNGASKLTDRLRPYFGMDRYHMKTASDPENSHSNPVITDADSSYVQYTSTDSERYFMTNLSTKVKNDPTRFTGWKDEYNDNPWYSPNPGYLTSVAYTDSFNTAAESSGNLYAMPYKYAELYYSDSTVNCQDVQFDMASFAKDGKYGTNKVSQNNQGLVTTFPFTIAKELNVGPTHGQAYALDLESDNMTVWYSLAGGNSAKQGSSLYAATPRDAMDNYFLYSYGNVFYCGAGHSDITGTHKDNNDERYLFINILCNSVRLSMAQPKIEVYEFDKAQLKEDKLPKDGTDYIMKVTEDTKYPEFNFKAITDTGTTISKVRIFYDLDYNTHKMDAYVNNANHKLIAEWDSRHVSSGQNKCVWRYDATLQILYDASGNQIPEEPYIDAEGNEITPRATMLRLLPEYFAPYNNEYTYIIIEVTDSKGETSWARIKIKLAPHLFDLT